MWLLTRFGGLPYLGSKTVIAALVALGWNYPLNRYFVFARHQGDEAAELKDGRSISPPV